MGAVASLGKDVGDDYVQVERDVKEVALSVLANEARMARSDEKIRKVRVSGPFKKTGRYRTCQIPAPAFKVHVHLCTRKPESQR